MKVPIDIRSYFYNNDVSIFGMVEMDSPHIRGIASSGILSYVKSKQGFLGTQGIVQIFDRECPAEIHTKLDDIKESDWYPMEFHIILLKCAAKVVGPGKDDRFIEMGRFNATHMNILKSYSESKKGFSNMVDRLPRTCAHLHNDSELNILENTSKQMVLSFNNCPQDDEICRYFQGFIEGLALLTRTKVDVESMGYSKDNGGSLKFKIVYST